MDMDKLLQSLREEEGWSASAYQDNFSYWTIGYGFLIDSRVGGYLPKEIGEAWLRYAAETRWKMLLSACPWLLGQPDDVQLAMGGLAYQLGVAGLLDFKNMLDALESNDREAAATHLLDSRLAQQTPARTKRMAALIRGHE